MIVFKLERERPAYASYDNQMVFYVKERYIRTCELSSSRDVPVLSIRNRASSGSTPPTNPKIRTLSYNAQDRAILISSDVEGGYYELYEIPKDGKGSDNVEAKRGLGVQAIFIGRKRFAVLDKSHQVNSNFFMLSW